MNDISLYLELMGGWLALMVIGIFFILFGKRIIKWLLSVLYDLFISHRDGFSDHS